MKSNIQESQLNTEEKKALERLRNNSQNKITVLEGISSTIDNIENSEFALKQMRDR